MHANGFFHCDLKAANILLFLDNNVIKAVKVTDFGHARQSTDTAKLSTNGVSHIGTAGHIAPEVFDKNQYDSKMDIWSLGIMMCSILVPGHLIFGEYVNREQFLTGLGNWNTFVEWRKFVDYNSSWYQFLSASTNYNQFLISFEMWMKDLNATSPTWYSDFKKIPGNAMDLMWSMLKIDPDERLDAEQILIHPWFQNNIVQ